MPHFDRLAFDADDTLWHNEPLYEQTQSRLADLLAPYGVESSTLNQQLYQTENRNIGLFGYGVKSFTLSMIETAVALSAGRLAARDVLAILDLAKAQLHAPVELLAHVAETVASLAAQYHLMIITKGDLHDQETKVTRSGLGDCFRDIEVVSDKTTKNYARLFKNRAIDPKRLLMVGNSLRSDILPVLELGASAVYVPYQITWLHEAGDAPAPGTPGFYQLAHLGQLPALLEQIDKSVRQLS